MNAFQKFYLWSLHAKSLMGLHFVSLVFLGGILTALYGGSTLELFTLLQMFLLSLCLAFIQVWLLPTSSDFTKRGFHLRLLLWLLAASFGAAFCAHFFDWLPGLPFWYPFLFGGFMLFVCGAMLVGLLFTQEAASKHKAP